MSVIGDIPHIPIYAYQPPLQAMPFHEFVAGNDAFTLAQIARLRQRRHHPATQVAFDATIAELAAGDCSPARSKAQLDAEFGVGQWRAIDRFVLSKRRLDGTLKLRPCDNARSSRHNDATANPNRVRLPSARTPAAIASAFRAAGCRATLHLGVDDMANAYRRVPSGQLNYSIVAVCHPASGAVQYHQIYGLNFGLSASVSQFSRLPHFLCASVCTLLAVPTDNYIDDIMHVDRAGALGQRFANRLFASLGTHFQLSKQLASAPANTILGVHTELTFSTCILTPHRTRASYLINELKALRAARIVHPDRALSLASQLSFMFAATAMRIGRSILRPLYLWGNRSSPTLLTDTDLDAVDAVIAFAQASPPHVLPLVPASPVVIYTDAHARSGTSSFGVGGLLYVDGASYVFSARVPSALIAAIRHHAPNPDVIIAHLELLAVPTAIQSFSALIANRSVFFFVDSTTAMGALANGTSSADALAALARYTHVLMANEVPDYWFEWIPTRVNPADGPSRGLLPDTATQVAPIFPLAATLFSTQATLALLK